MNRVHLLHALKTFSEDAYKDLILPVKMQKGDAEQKYRAPETHLMRLPEKTMNTDKAPYVIHQMITGQDRQSAGQRMEARAVVRSICCVYNDNSEEGSLALMTLIERMRIGLLTDPWLDGQYCLDLDEGLETLIYPDETDPFFLGELVSTWVLPRVQREVQEIWK